MLLQYSKDSETAVLHEAVIYKTSGGCEPLQVPPIKIIVLTECNPSVLTADKFGKLKRQGYRKQNATKQQFVPCRQSTSPFSRGRQVVIVRGE